MELPVVVVLVVLWLLGALILGAVAVVAYSASGWLQTWLSAATTPWQDGSLFSGVCGI